MRYSLVILVVVLVALAQAARDIYVPSLPAISHYFAITHTQVQLTLSLYLFGFAISQLYFGALADRYPQRIIFTIGIILYLAGCLLSLFAPNVIILLISRLIEGLAVGVAPCFARILMQSHFSSKEDFSRITHYYSLGATLTPTIAPIIGGYLLVIFASWRVNFIVLFLFGVLGLLMYWRIVPHTKSAVQKEQPHFFAGLRFLIRFRPYLTFVSCNAITSASISTVNIVYPYFVQHELHYSASGYGWITASIVVAFIVGLQISKRKNKHSQEKTARCIILYSLLLMVFAVLLLLGAVLAHWNTLFATLLPLLLFFVGTGIVFPIAMQLALQSTSLYPGAKAGLLGATQMFGGAFLGAIAALFSPHNLLALSLILLIMVGLVTIQYSFFLRTKIEYPR